MSAPWPPSTIPGLPVRSPDRGYGYSVGCCKSVASDSQTRRKSTKERSLRAVNEHLEAIFNAVWLSAVAFATPSQPSVMAADASQGVAFPAVYHDVVVHHILNLFQ